MKRNEKNLLWIHHKHHRYFLIPINQELPEGDFSIQSLTGSRKNVNPICITPFEINREEAKPYIQVELDKALKKTKEAFATFTNFAAAAQGQPTETKAPQPPQNPLAALLGVSQEELSNNPDAVKESWQNLVQGFQDVLRGATSDDPTHLETAKTQIQRLQHHLQAQGIDVDNSIQDLPNKLREKYQSPESDPNLKTSAEKLQEASQNVSRSFNDLLQTLEDGANKLRDAIKEAEAKKSKPKNSKTDDGYVRD